MKPWFDDLPLDFTRTETRQAERLLTEGYSNNFAALALAQNAGLSLAALNQMAPIKFLMRDIMVKARLADRLMQLLAEVLSDPEQDAINQEIRPLVAGHEGAIAAAAMRRKPSIATLARLPPSIEVWARSDPNARSTAEPGFEKTINAAAGFSDPAVFRMRLAEAELRTARIDIGGKAKGTGFLVGDSLLLTNWHVVKRGVQGAVAVFDNKVSPIGRTQAGGRPVRFAEEWRIAHSPHEPAAIEIGPSGPPVGTLDFALVRLAEPVGTQAIGPDPQAQDADRRGSYKLDGGDYLFDQAEPIFILGHPAGRPVQFSYAGPSQVRTTEHGNRVRYHTNTEGGSSGSPVFNRDWRVVALHHAAGPTSTPGEFNLQTNEFNQGIPISAIVAELRAQLKGRPELQELALA